MRRFIEWLIVFLIMAGIILLIAKAQAGEYIITTYGGGEAITIEHDGVIHAWGRDSPDISKDWVTDIPVAVTIERSFSYQKIGERSEETALSTNKPEDYYMAALHYDSAGNEEKAKEMAEKEIELLVTRETYTGYQFAAITARLILRDEHLEEFYKQKAEQLKLNREVQ